MINAPISIGELFDKISILHVKIDNGIEEARKELLLLEELVPSMPIAVEGLYNALKAINSYCWMVEDNKRECERQQDFDEHFIENARAVYILNDERARLKKLINKYMNSEIAEYKGHRDY